MKDENELIQVTIRLPLREKEKIDNLAKSGGCSTAEIIRRAVDKGKGFRDEKWWEIA